MINENKVLEKAVNKIRQTSISCLKGFITVAYDMIDSNNQQGCKHLKKLKS